METMQLDSQTANHTEHKLKISIEPHEEKTIHYVTPDGKEHIVLEPSKEEKFTALVRQIDWNKYSDATDKSTREDQVDSASDAKEEEKVVQPTGRPAWEWTPVAEPLFRARVEIEQLIGLINLLTGPQPQVSLFYINKPVQPQSHGELAIREVTKQKELQTAASHLAEGAARLKKIVNREQIFFDDLLQIRSRWLITNKQPLASRKNPALAGSTVKAEAELLQTSTGNVSVVFPSTSGSKIFRMFTTNAADGLTRSTVMGDNNSQDTFKDQLLRAQQSQFYTELFQQLAHDALLKNLSYVHVIDNEIKLEDDTENSLTIRLDTKSHLKTKQEPALAKRPRDLPFEVFEIVLQQLLRQHYLSNLSNNKDSEGVKIPIEKQIEGEVLGRNSGILDSFLALYKHYCLCKRVKDTLNKIASGLPGIFVHWYATNKPFISAFELQFGKRFSLDVTIDNTSILVAGAANRTPIVSADELGRFLVFKLTKQIIDDIYKEASVYFKNRVKRENATLYVHYPSKTISISLQIANDFEIGIVVTEVNEETRRVERIPFTWKRFFGTTTTEKLRSLLSTAKTRSIKHLDDPSKSAPLKVSCCCDDTELITVQIHVSTPSKPLPPSSNATVHVNVNDNPTEQNGHSVPAATTPISTPIQNDKPMEIEPPSSVTKLKETASVVDGPPSDDTGADSTEEQPETKKATRASTRKRRKKS